MPKTEKQNPLLRFLDGASVGADIEMTPIVDHAGNLNALTAALAEILKDDAAAAQQIMPHATPDNPRADAKRAVYLAIHMEANRIAQMPVTK